MTKLEWREIAPPCEKKSHLRLSITFHLSCRQIQLHSIHVSCDFEFSMFGRLIWRTYFFRMAGFHNVYFCDDCLAVWYNLLRPSLLYQRSVKRRHHWACPMCLCGTLRWSGGGGVVDGLLPIWKFLTWKFFVS